MPECFKVVCIPYKALYKCFALPYFDCPSVYMCVCVYCYLQWLQCVARLHTDITKFLSSTTVGDATVLPPATKPTASVLPQVQPSDVTSVESATDLAMVSDIPVAMETETDEAETTVSAEMSEVNVSLETLSRDTSSSDIEQHSYNAAAETQQSAVCCESNCCHDVNASQKTDFLSLDDCCQATSCHSNGIVSVKTETSRCSDYEAASVLTDMQQLSSLAVCAVSHQPGTTLGAVSTSLNTMSYGRSTDVNTVDCEPAVPPVTSSGFADIPGRTLSSKQ